MGDWTYGENVDVWIDGRHFVYGRVRFKRKDQDYIGYTVEFPDGRYYEIPKGDLREPPLER